MKQALEKSKILAALEECFYLAPNDDEYLRLLVKDYLDFLRTGKNAAARQHDKRKELGFE